jgi:hypothetical protein
MVSASALSSQPAVDPKGLAANIEFAVVMRIAVSLLAIVAEESTPIGVVVAMTVSFWIGNCIFPRWSILTRYPQQTPFSPSLLGHRYSAGSCAQPPAALT